MKRCYNDYETIRPTPQQRRGWQLGMAIALGVSRAISLLGCLAIAFVGSRALAQITPDDTLGSESSIVTPNVEVRGHSAELIEGGATRGSNLFHSFSDFNVGENLRVYFANPTGIENILSRVTGSNISNILGTLGVDGGANLFLLNPNGIIFGPNATLDISGSFVGSTADSVVFGNGWKFSTNNPEAPPLLAINVPIGLQYGANPSGAVENAGNLAVGKDLILSGASVTSTGQLEASTGNLIVDAVDGDAQVQQATAQTANLFASNNLILEESQLQTTGDMTLQADNTVRVRDSVDAPFLAQAGGNLLIEGIQGIDILALNHLEETPFQSGGTLSLVSDGIISGDSHFASGGNFSILNSAGQPGDFVSFYDPIISANGDVTFGNYTGVALKVEATGSINVTGNITITGPDTSLSQSSAIGNFTPTGTGTSFSGNLSNGTGSVTASGLQNFLGIGSLSGTPLNNGTATEGSAFRTTIKTTAPNQTVSFNWDYNTSESNGSFFNDFGFATLNGAVVDTVELADTNTPAANRSGTQSFTITTPGTYNLGVGVVDVGDTSFDTSLQINNFLLNGTALDINLSNDPDIPTLTSSSALILRAGVAGKSDNVTFPYTQTNSGNPSTVFTKSPLTTPATITVNGNINTSSTTTNGGPVILAAPGDINITGSINTSSSSGNGGLVNINSSQGNINLKNSGSTNNVSNPPFSLNTSSQFGSGGDITIMANDTNRTVSIDKWQIRSDTTGSGNAGDINITAGSIDLKETNINAEIGLNSTYVDTQLFLFDKNGTSLISNDDEYDLTRGAGGSTNIRDSYFTYNLEADKTYILGVGAYYSYVKNNPPNPIEPLDGARLQSGSYTLQVSVQNQEYTQQSGNRPLAALPENEDNNTISTAQNITSAFTLGTNPNIESSDTIPYVSMLGAGNGTFDYYSFTTTAAGLGIFDIDTGAGGEAGSITLTATGTPTQGTTLGNITISNSTISNQVRGDTRNPANITVTTQGGAVELSNDSRIDASTTGKGTGGNLIVNSNGGAVSLNNSVLTVETQAQGQGGNIDIDAGSVALANNSSLNASVSGSGAGGNISVTTTNLTTNPNDPTAFPLSLSNSSISTAVEPSATVTGKGGNIELTTDALSVTQGSRIQALTRGGGAAGNVQLNVDNTIDISGASKFGLFSGVLASSETETSGQGGNITINESNNPRGSLRLSDGAFLSARTRSNHDGGTIEVNVTNLGISNGGQILTTSASSSSGKAGDMTINATGSVTISGSRTPPSTITSPFDNTALNVQSLSGFSVGDNPNVEDSNTIPFVSLTPTNNGNFVYYSFTITADGSRGIFDIDNGYEGYGVVGSIDTELFLFNRDSGELLASNDDFYPPETTGAKGSTYGLDSYISYIFNSSGNYVIGIGEYNSYASSSSLTPISGDAPDADDVFTLQVSLQNQGTGGNFNPENLNPNQGLNSGLFAQAEGTGNSGNLTINTHALTVENTGVITASTTSGIGGNVTLQGFNDQPLETLRVINSLVSASTASGTAGNIAVSAAQAVELSGALPPDNNGELQGGLSAQATESVGNAGNVTINTRQLSVADGAQVEASNISGFSGDITLQGLETLQVTGGGSISATTQTGRAGSLLVNDGENAAQFVQVSGQGSRLSAGATGEGGNARRVTINTRQLSVADGAQVEASNVSGLSEDITLQGLDTLQVTGGGQISAETNTGRAGSLRVNNGENAAQFVQLSGSGSSLSAGATGEDGNAGSVTINTRQLSVADGAQVEASNISGVSEDITLQGLDTLQVTGGGQISASTHTGRAGNLRVNVGENAAELVQLSGQGSRLSAEATKEGGDAQSVTINTQQLSLSDGAQISASNISKSSGDITLQGVNTLEVNDSLISASTHNGTAGNLIVNASESVRLSGTFNGRPGGLSVQATDGGNAGSMSISTGELAITNGASATVSSTKSGTAGSLDVRARSISLNNNASLSATNESSQIGGDITLEGIDNQQPLETVEVNNSLISASTQSGTAGNLSINAAESVRLNGTLADGTAGGLAVSATNGGNAGSLSVTTGELNVQNGAQATVSSTGTGTAGSLNVNAQTVTLNNQARLSAETAGGSGGNIELVGLNTLEVNNSLISASTQSGTAGNLSVNATESVRLNGTLADGTAGGLAVSATNGGNAGSLSITTDELTVQNGAQATVSSTGKGTAGSLNVNAQTVALNNQGKLSAETEAGSGGNITLQGLNTLNVNNSRISASTQNGTAGDVTINASDSVRLRGEGGLFVEATNGGIAGNLRITTGDFIVSNGAQATVSSPDGQAGNLSVTADSIRLNRGKLTAETGGGNGGANILLNVSDILWMENESLISANASGTANGGNITINTTFIIALPPEGPEGSDIVANAFQGNGGKVNVTAQGILNIQFRPKRTPLNDITASSQFGAAGVVAINTPNVDPSRGLTSLPTDLVDPTGLIDRSCQAGGSEEASAFTITGRGGLPPNPNEPLGEEGLLDDLGVPVSSGNGQQSGVSADWLISNSSTPAQIIEAQGWVRQPNGTVVLVAQTPSATPQSPRTNPASCQVTSHSATSLTASPR